MNLGRRKFVQLSLGAAALPAMAGGAWAQSFPSRPINLVVFLPAGAIPDIIARLIGSALSERLGQPIIIENRPGGGGNIALHRVTVVQSIWRNSDSLSTRTPSSFALSSLLPAPSPANT